MSVSTSPAFRRAIASLGAVLETLEYLKNKTKVWFEITTLLIPGHNDSGGGEKAERMGDDKART
jgi:pyruvate-formate lyase-activating enzyme